MITTKITFWNGGTGSTYRIYRCLAISIGIVTGACGAAAPPVDRESTTSAAATPCPSCRQSAFVTSYGGLPVPATGAFWGAYDSNGFTASNGIETEMSRRMAIRNREYGFPGLQALPMLPTSAEINDTTLAKPRVVSMVTLYGKERFPVFTTMSGKNWDTSANAMGDKGLDRITNGEWDNYWNDVAVGLASLKVPVLFRWCQEPNGNSHPYNAEHQGGEGVGEAKFVAAWRHIWTIFNNRGATLESGGKVIWVFSVQASSSGGDWRDYWPGDRYVDWAGEDIYRKVPSDVMDNPSAGQDFYQFFTRCRDGARFNHTVNKPMVITEGGFEQGVLVNGKDGLTYDKDGTVPGNTGGALIDKTRSQLKDYLDIIGYVHWNAQGPIGTNFIDTSTTSINKYTAWGADPYWLVVY